MIENVKEDKFFWDKFYKDKGAPKKPSNFAKLALNSIDKETTILELGCGNGRDSFFFARNGVNVIAVDRSSMAIELNRSFEIPNISFRQMDFTRITESQVPENLDSIYSRFTLHSVDKKGFSDTLEYCTKKLKAGGKFFIEARTVNDPLYGVGEPCPDDGFITTHYRRFLRTKEVMSELSELGFKLELVIEDFLDSWYKTDHAVVLRIIASKA